MMVIIIIISLQQSPHLSYVAAQTDIEVHLGRKTLE